MFVSREGMDTGSPPVQLPCVRRSAVGQGNAGQGSSRAKRCGGGRNVLLLRLSALRGAHSGSPWTSTSTSSASCINSVCINSEERGLSERGREAM